MSLIPIPTGPKSVDGLLDWAKRLTAYLQLPDTVVKNFEVRLGLEDAEMAARIVGFEGTFSGYTAPDSALMVSAPAAGKKRVIVWLAITSEETAAAGKFIRAYVLKNAVEHEFYLGTVDKDAPYTIAGSPRITLDETDESLRIGAVDGTADLHWVGSYLDLD